MKRLQYSSYYDKVLGGWLGKCAGGSLGAPVEGIKATNIIAYYSSSDKAQIANDDLDIQLVWVHALKQRGPDITERDLMEEWMDHVTFPWSEYGYALRNFRTAICPPVAGWFNNSYYGESMGCPIRSEIWGMICPGYPELAADYAGKDASLDHFGNSVYAERFLSAIEAAAFVEDDIDKLLQTGLSFIPEESRLSQCIDFTMKCFADGLPMMVTRELVLNRFSHPDFTSSVQNMAFIAIGLLYGGGDFENTLVRAVNCGYDADCTGATAGAIMGIILGASKLPAKWIDPIGDTIISYLKIEDLLAEPSINKLAEETCTIGLATSLTRATGYSIDAAPAKVVDAAKMISNKPKDDISVDIEYLGMPSISFGEPGNVRAMIRNHSDRNIDGLVELNLPAHLCVNNCKIRFSLHAQGETHADISISLMPGADLPLRNVIAYTCVYNGSTTTGQFGFSGAAQWMVMGPFWEQLPASAIKPLKYYAHDTQSLPPYETMVMNAAYLDKQYLPEPQVFNSSSDATYFEKVIVNASEDKVDLDNIFSLKGPQVVYLYREITCNDERMVWMVMGANDGIKLWVNEQECVNNTDRGYTFPGQHSAEVCLKAGVNSILIKVARFGASFDFSFAIKEHNERHWHQEQHMVDYSNVQLLISNKKTADLHFAPESEVISSASI